MFKLVTFDAHGTLLKLRKPVGEIYAEAGKRFGIQADPDLLTSCFYKNFAIMNDNHHNFGLSSGIGWKNWWKHLVETTFQCALSKGGEVTETEKNIRLASDLLIDLFNTKEGWVTGDGAVECLESLKRSNTLMGVISNFDPRLTSILKELGLDRYFSFVITSYECGYLKPDVQIFRIAEAMFEEKSRKKLVLSSALHVGDSVKHDYQGAKNAGWEAALISDEPTNWPVTVDKKFIFRNFKDLERRLFNIEN